MFGVSGTVASVGMSLFALGFICVVLGSAGLAGVDLEEVCADRVHVENLKTNLRLLYAGATCAVIGMGAVVLWLVPRVMV